MLKFQVAYPKHDLYLPSLELISGELNILRLYGLKGKPLKRLGNILLVQSTMLVLTVW